MDTESRRALFADVHKAIDDAANAAVDDLSGTQDISLSYPPGTELSANEQKILSGINLSDDERMVLKKVIRDACSYPTFHMLSLLDGVTDPQVIEFPDWDGGSLATSEDGLMLHDEFHETYRYHQERMGS